MNLINPLTSDNPLSCLSNLADNKESATSHAGTDLIVKSFSNSTSVDQVNPNRMGIFRSEIW
jgi:hypothetical protein